MDDDESQWKRGKFDPMFSKNPLTDGTKICVGNYIGDIYHHAKNLFQIGLGVSVLRMRDFSPLGIK